MENKPLIVTAAQMKEIERKADEAGLGYYQMMENAGTAAFEIMTERYPGAENIVIYAGKGNNAGDGFVCARLFAVSGKTVKVILVEGEPVTADAITNYRLLGGLPVEIMPVTEINEPPKADIVVDAIYGTGFHGELRPAGRRACDLINESDGAVIALDIPSGVNCDSAQAADGAVRDELTISFHAFKNAHVSKEAAVYCGESVLADIGIR